MKITDSKGNPIQSKVPDVVDVQPVGTQIIVELIGAQELAGGSIIVDNDVKLGAPQAYVLATGPKVDVEWGVKVGDRVVLSGKYTPLPEAVSKSGRPVGAVEPHMIKAILIEK